MKKSGKVATIFIAVTAILLVSLTAISLFFFQQEHAKRKVFEDELGEVRTEITQLQKEISEINRTKFVLEEKNKELDERINGLLDELELEQGLKEEMQREQVLLNERIEKELKSKEKFKEELSKKNEDYQLRVKELEDKLRKEIELTHKLTERNRLLENENIQLADGLGISDYVPSGKKEPLKSSSSRTKTGMDLDQIVVASSGDDIYIIPDKIPTGHIISVDEETDFVIIDLGKKHGITLGRSLSVYRGDKYLGDVKITRVQPEMAAADLVLPLTGKVVRKNDQVIVK